MSYILDDCDFNIIKILESGQMFSYIKNENKYTLNINGNLIEIEYIDYKNYFNISEEYFYKELFNLDKWFKNRIIYDDGSVRGKPFPDLYLKAGKILNLPMEDIIIVEDACAGVKAAKNAGAGLVVGIAPYGEEMFVGKEYTDILIKDFTVFDRNLFEC